MSVCVCVCRSACACVCVRVCVCAQVFINSPFCVPSGEIFPCQLTIQLAHSLTNIFACCLYACLVQLVCLSSATCLLVFCYLSACHLRLVCVSSVPGMLGLLLVCLSSATVCLSSVACLPDFYCLSSGSTFVYW